VARRRHGAALLGWIVGRDQRKLRT